MAGRGGRLAAALPTRPAHVWAAGAIAVAVLRCGAAVAGDDACGGAQAAAATLLPWAAGHATGAVPLVPFQPGSGTQRGLHSDEGTAHRGMEMLGGQTGCEPPVQPAPSGTWA